MGWRQVGKPKITESVHNFPLPPVAVDPLSSHIFNQEASAMRAPLQPAQR